MPEYKILYAECSSGYSLDNKIEKAIEEIEKKVNSHFLYGWRVYQGHNFTTTHYNGPNGPVTIIVTQAMIKD